MSRGRLLGRSPLLFLILLDVKVPFLIIRGNRLRSWVARKIERSAFRELTPGRDSESRNHRQYSSEFLPG
jgi:hypothetical protein